MKIPAVAWVTGSARRVGAAIARELHHCGYNLVVHCHQSLSEANGLCQQLNALRVDSARVLQMDLRATPADLAAGVEKVVSFWGRLDVLVNNASRFYKGTLAESTPEMWEDLMGTNAGAPFFLAKAAAPHLADHQQGSIVNIADIHGDRPLKNYDIYCLSKAALRMLTRVLARELAPSVRVNSVSPGAVAWPEGGNALSAAQQEMILRRAPLGRHGRPEDIAKAVRFLVRDARYVTGENLVVDGGRSVSVMSEN